MSKTLAPEDESAIRELRRKLWSGRASVMIGAGFSMNADLLNWDGPRFPSWNELAVQLFEKIHARSAKLGDHLDPINLASQYAAHAKEIGIVSFLMDTVGAADQNSQPGELHRMILSLPWADVYTTNYDTLLERALPDVIQRRYQIITKQQQIPQSRRPRIVKLHGSIPNITPLIFTQEHYRRYPSTHAGFINTVQQSIMETALCLIGFSGSDPNFLSWIGWIRDHLGEHAPHVYLCGILNASNSQRQYYDELRVKPVDLAAVFPPSDFHDSATRHKTALTWFLHNLNHAPQDKTNWPLQSDSGRGKRTGDLWKLPPGIPPVLSISNSPSDSAHPNLVAQVRNLIGDYPGWVVLPFRKRRPALKLLEHIYKDPEFTVSLSLEKAQALLRLHSLTQTPLVDAVFTDNIAALAMARSDVATGREKLDLAILATDLSECFREQGRYVEAERSIEVAEKIVSPRTAEYNRVKYEKCLILIETLNIEALAGELDRWSPISGDLVNTLRHSSLVYEFRESDDDDMGRHSQVCKTVLHRVRQAISESDLSSLSKPLIGSLAIEGQAELFLRQATNTSSPDTIDLLEPPEERHLRNSDALADLGGELRRYVDGLMPDLRSHRGLIFESNFDSHRHIYKTTYPGPEEVGIHELIRVLQSCGAPYSHDHTVFISSKVGSKLGSLGANNPLRALSILARCNANTTETEKHWNMWSVRTMAEPIHAHAISACLRCIEYGARRLESTAGSLTPVEYRFLRASLVFCGIAISACPSDSKDRAFHAVAKCYTVVTRKVGVFNGLMEETSKCLSRIFSDVNPRSEHLLVLANLPMWGFGDCVAPESLPGRPEVFEHLRAKKPTKECNMPQQIIDQLRIGLSHSALSVRYAAVLRYDFLNKCGIVSREQSQALNRALWSTAAGGLPKIPFVSPPSFLRFTEGCGMEGLHELVKRHQMHCIRHAQSHTADLSHLPVEVRSEITVARMIDSKAVSDFAGLISSTTSCLSMNFPGSLPEGWSTLDAKSAIADIAKWVANFVKDLPSAEELGGPFHGLARALFEFIFIVAWPLSFENREIIGTELLFEMLTSLGKLGIKVECVWSVEGDPQLDISGLLLADAPIKSDLGNLIVRQWMRWSTPDSWGVSEDVIDTAMFEFSRMSSATCQTATHTVIYFLKLPGPLRSRHTTSLRARLFTAGLTKLLPIVSAADHAESAEYYWIHGWLTDQSLAAPARQLCQDKRIADAFWPDPVAIP